MVTFSGFTRIGRRSYDGDTHSLTDFTDEAPEEAADDPGSYMQPTNSNNDTCLKIASSPGAWTNIIELTGVDWLQGNTSIEALKQQMIEQNHLVTIPC